jgi:hypothetical protein
VHLSRHPLHGASRRRLSRNSLGDIRARQETRRAVAEDKAIALVNGRERIALLKAAGLPLPGQPGASRAVNSTSAAVAALASL